jgi:hypothetical protein
MKPASADGQNESTEKPLPDVLQIASSDEFEQSFAVAQLAVKLCELEIARRQTSLQKDEAMEKVVGRKLQESYVPFKELCDPEHKGDSKPIQLFDAESGRRIKVHWKVYTTERAFEDLFWAYWRDIPKQWKKEFSSDPDRYDKRRIEAELADVCSQIKTREDALHGANADERRLRRELHVLGEKRMDLEQRKHLVDPVNDDHAWEKRGQSVLDSWKKNGVSPNTFLALARCRKARGQPRAANLIKTPKPKRTLRAVKSRKH